MNVIELVEAGDVAGVLRELAALAPQQRARHAPEPAARLEATSTPDWVALTTEQRTALLSAVMACQVTATATAAFALGHKFRNVYPGPATNWMVAVVNLYPATWQAEFVARLGEQAEGPLPDSCFVIADHIVRTTGAPVPTSDSYINAWLSNRAVHPTQERPMHVLDGARGTGLLERLRNDGCTATLLPLAVQRQGVDIGWWEPMTVLAADGVIDRTALVRRLFAAMARTHPAAAAKMLETVALTPDEHARMAPERVPFLEPLIARLLLDGSRHGLTPHLAFLRALAPTPAENAPFLRDHVAMLDLSLPVAAYGQEVLIALDGAGLVEDDVFTEACERVLLRPEKKLVRAQLSWIGRLIKRDPARAGQLLADVSITFRHQDVALQEKALDLVAKHLPAAGGPAPRTAVGQAVLPELRAAAEALSPGLAARATELFGPAPCERPSGEPFEEVLPVVPEPRPVPGPIETPAEVAQEVAAVLANDHDVVAFERALDGLVRHSRLDRAALSQALGPVLRREPPQRTDYTSADLYDVAAAVRGDEPRDWHIRLRADHPLSRRFPDVGPRPSLAGTMLLARLDEAIDLVESGTRPFLLAVPTDATGALDAAVLVERIAAYESLDVTPAPIDLAQALLRVTPVPCEAAGELRSDAGRRLARWLEDGGLPHQDSTPEGWPADDPCGAAPGRWHPERPGLDVAPGLPPAAVALLGPDKSFAPADAYASPYWLAQLPHHRDEVAARTHQGETLRSHLFPALAESGGPAGYAVHWQIANALSWRPEAAVDALLVLAARGQLDTRLFAGVLQAQLRKGWHKPNRAADALRAAAETGAYGTVWSVFEAALPALLRDEPIRGAATLLALAVECASRCGAKGGIAEVDALAARSGSSQMVKNARLLRDVLA
ncbi:DUF6493 family protein [Nonomuraea sp. GTA35]|uniref:DUF6493 family protein n=1 Tax=Nonomuraea sp. GTA35 TaxID=1676746 RepID=UPI0035C0935A